MKKLLQSFCMNYSTLRQHLAAFWQVSHSVTFIYLMPAGCGLLLFLPDQSRDMIDAFGQESVLLNFFWLKALSVCVWTATVWQCARIILLSPGTIDLSGNKEPVQFWLLWLPRFLGILAGLLLVIVFIADGGHASHGLLLSAYVALTFVVLVAIESKVKQKNGYVQPFRDEYLARIQGKRPEEELTGYWKPTKTHGLMHIESILIQTRLIPSLTPWIHLLLRCIRTTSITEYPLS